MVKKHTIKLNHGTFIFVIDGNFLRIYPLAQILIQKIYRHIYGLLSSNATISIIILVILMLLQNRQTSLRNTQKGSEKVHVCPFTTRPQFT